MTDANVISGSDYPTSNLFLREAIMVKRLLDSRLNNEDDFIRAMVLKMKTISIKIGMNTTY